MKFALPLAAVAVVALVAASADARTLRWARPQEALTLDPHSQNEGPTTALLAQIYEPLVNRNMEGKLEPGLATSWAVSPTDPTVWVLTIREGVKFHDGTPFTAEDAAFSIDRAKSEASNFKELLVSIVEAKAVDAKTLHLRTNGPNPILPQNLTSTHMVSKAWAEKNNVVAVQNYAKGEENYAARNVNGTGPYTLVSREPDARTVLRVNPAYWGHGTFPMEVTEVVMTPIQNPATRVAALLSGEVDFIQEVPVQDLERIAGTAGLRLGTAPQNRTIFFGMNVSATDLASDNVEGKNPFADRRVREAMNIAINRDAIKQVVMRGQSQPTGIIMPPFVNGWTAELDTYPKVDIARARQLLTEAGYPNGFSTTLDCPNDRYVNDEAICQATVGMLGQIGIKAMLQSRPRAQHFPLLANLQTDFYMLGWGVPTYDSEYIFNFLYHTRTDKYGSWNATRFSNDSIDEIVKSLASNTDIAARNADIAKLWATLKDEVVYLPLHHQVINWGLSTKVDTIVDPGDAPQFKYFRMSN